MAVLPLVSAPVGQASQLSSAVAPGSLRNVLMGHLAQASVPTAAL